MPATRVYALEMEIYTCLEQMPEATYNTRNGILREDRGRRAALLPRTMIRNAVSGVRLRGKGRVPKHIRESCLANTGSAGLRLHDGNGLQTVGAILSNGGNSRSRICRPGHPHRAMMLAVSPAAERYRQVSSGSQCRQNQQPTEHHCQDDSNPAPHRSLSVSQNRSQLSTTEGDRAIAPPVTDALWRYAMRAGTLHAGDLPDPMPAA